MAVGRGWSWGATPPDPAQGGEHSSVHLGAGTEGRTQQERTAPWKLDERRPGRWPGGHELHLDQARPGREGGAAGTGDAGAHPPGQLRPQRSHCSRGPQATPRPSTLQPRGAVWSGRGGGPSVGSAMGLWDSFCQGLGGSGRGLPVAPTLTSIACLSSFLHLSSVPLRARTRILYFRNAQMCWQGGGRGLAPEPSSPSSW